MKSKKTFWIFVVIFVVLSGILYVNKELKEIDACASHVNESSCFEEYYKNSSWFERWFFSSKSNISKEPESQAEYETTVVSKCVKAWNESSTTVKTSKESTISACVYVTVLNDTMADEIMRGYAEQALISSFVQEAKDLTNVELLQRTKGGLNSLLNSNYETETGLRINAYSAEIYKRGIKDADINNLTNSMLDRYGPCWGIQSGQCGE